MHGLSPTELLTVWERGEGSTALERGLLLLSCCLPDDSWAQLAAVPIGKRNTLLVELRGATLGTTLRCFAVCPGCGGQLEFEINADDLCLAAAPEQNGPLQFERDGRRTNCRLPDSTDLYAASRCGSVEEACRTIALRCVEKSSQDEGRGGEDELSAAALDAFGDFLSENDPAAEISLDVTCPACGHRWEPSLDIVNFFWREIQSAARRIVLEVDALARAYGWSEAAILGMSTSRRNLYLEMVG
jgi:hypothetical protein